MFASIQKTIIQRTAQRLVTQNVRNASSLVIAEHNNASVGEATFSAIAAASQLGETTVLVGGKDCGKVAEEVAKCKGVTKVVVADNPALEYRMPETFAPFISGMSSNYTHVFVGASSFGKNLLPRAAVLSDMAPISEITSIQSEDTFVRPMYAGNAMATVQSSDTVKFISVRSTSFPSLGASDSSAPIESCEGSTDGPKSEHVAYELSNTSGPSLTSASNVVSGGRGMGNGDNFKMLYDMCDKLSDCAVGASRAAVDAGFVGNDLQVGQTGKVVAPQLYVAVGISGAIQHLAGMKDSKVIVAINKDAEAPIFQVADYGIVGDLFEVVPEFNSKL